MKLGDLVAPTWVRKTRGIANYELGIVLEQNSVQVKVAVIYSKLRPLDKERTGQWYHCSHWRKYESR